jgi:uncharacterized protein (DUF2132 family)
VKPEIELTRCALHRQSMAASSPSNDPLHGVTLERIVTELSTDMGWDELGRRVPVRCFLFDPSVKSSLTFLRKTPWARAKVEQIYVESRRAK